MDTTNLVAWLPFDVDATTDLCENTWTAYGSPTIGANGAINGNSLQLDGSSYLQKSGSISLGGQDFTICGWAKMDSNGWYDGLFSVNNKQIRICGIERYTDRLLIAIKTKETIVQNLNLTDRFHWELNYTHSSGTWRVFFNGILIHSKTSALSRTSYATFLIGSNGDVSPASPRFWHGSIDEFQIYDEFALHTENFTPPTAEDYATSGAPITLTADLQRKIAVPVDFTADVQRIIREKIFFKPEVFMSWVPTGEINIRPEIYASLIDDIIDVEFAVDLSRKVVQNENIRADIQRKITKTVNFTVDTKRITAEIYSVVFDTLRNIVHNINQSVDLQSKLANVVEVPADIQRRLANVTELVADLQRSPYYNNEFTVDLQRKTIWQWLTRILPDSSFLDSKMYASAEALDCQITAFHQSIREVLHLPRIDELSGTILDLLAEQFHVDYYDAINFSDEEKRNLIRQSIAWHRIKGTPAAVHMVLQDAFKDLHIDEWFTYGGAPYYFRLRTKGYISTPERFKSFWLMFMDAKNVRSQLEKIIIDHSHEDPIQLYTGVAKVESGLKIIGLPRPKDIKNKIYVGVARVETGTKIINLPVQKNIGTKIYAGVFKFCTGTVFTGMKCNPF